MNNRVNFPIYQLIKQRQLNDLFVDFDATSLYPSESGMRNHFTRELKWAMLSQKI